MSHNDSPPPTHLERNRERSPGILILFAHAATLTAHERAVDAGEHPTCLYHLRHAVDALERAHRNLERADGTAILHDGDPEPVDTWPGSATPAELEQKGNR